MFSAMLYFWLLALLDNSTAKNDPIPDKESEQWTGYSVALHIFLPIAGFCILWGRRDLLTRLMLQIDRNCISVFCPSLSKREKLLKWASENLPSTWSSPSKTLSGGIPELWKDGSLLCTLINMAVPGACPNPPKHWKRPPTHAQALAFKYLGVTPVFTESDLEGSFSPTQEKKFLLYLQDIQQAMKKRNIENNSSDFSSSYLTKGMGLQTGEQYRKTLFYVYSTSTTDSNCNNILVYIRGPYGSQGTATVPAFHNLNSISVLNYLHKQFRPSDKIVYKKEARRSFLESIALDFTSFVHLDRKVSTNDVPIHVEMENDRVKITYIPNNYGIYEINLITDGEILRGSPYTANIVENITGLKDSFESTERILNELPVIRKKRIVSRYIDCINEKIQLEAMEDDIHEKSSIEKSASVSIVNDNQDDAQQSEVLAESDALSLAVVPYETQPNIQDTQKYQSESFQKLEKIHEDQYEGEEPDYLQNDNLEHSTHGNEVSEKSLELTPRDVKLIPTVSVTGPEEDGNVSEITDYYMGYGNEEYQNDIEDNVNSGTNINSSETNRKTDKISSFNELTEDNIEENQNDAVASIKPFMHYPEDTRTSEENEQASSGEKYMIRDQNRNHIREIREIYEKSSDNSSLGGMRSDANITKIKFNKNEQDYVAISEGPNQNRPTSIVSPFLKITKLTAVENDVTLSEIDHKEIKFSITDARENFREKFNSSVEDLNYEVCLQENEVSCVLPTDQSDGTYQQSKMVEASPNCFTVSNEEKQTFNQKWSAITPEYSDVNEQDTRENNIFIRNNYVENLKAILMTKMTSQSNNTKTIKNLVNITNKLKTLNSHSLQDENNNEFKHESSLVASPICPDHIDQEVEKSMPQSFGKLSLSEKRKFFTKQQCTSTQSSNNSSISNRENEDVCEQLDGNKYNLRVLSVIDTIKKTSGGNILNRNTSISVPNISKSKQSDTDYSSLTSPKAASDFRSSFLKTREYWKKMSSENCLTSSSHSSLYKRESVLNTEIGNLKNSLVYSPDIHRSADDILSMSMNFKSNRLRRYSSLNQKDLEAIDFISIEERKKKLLQDKYEQECLGSTFTKKHISLSKSYQELNSEKIQDVKKINEWPSEIGVSRSLLSSSNIEHPNTNSTPQNEELKEEPKVRKGTRSSTQFKRAITFFKNLEKSSLGKKKPMEHKRFEPVARRRFSLDFQKQHKDKPRIGGSLRTPKTLEKFSVTQIYFDIMSNRRGSFKGSPNRKALSETLASLSTNDNSTQSKHEKSEDGIKYNMFANKLKTKKRRSIKSVFDIHY